MVAVGQVLDTFCMEPMATGEDVDGWEKADGFKTNGTIRVGDHMGGVENNFFEVVRIMHTWDAHEDVVQETMEEFFGFFWSMESWE